MKTNILLLIASLFVFIVPGCISGKKVQTKQKELIIQYEQQPSLGLTEVYIFKIFSDGSAQLDAIDQMPNKGIYTANIAKDKLKEVQQWFDESHFFELQDSYTEQARDIAIHITMYSNNGQKKSIMNHYGAPTELKTLERKLHQLKGQLDWKESK